MKDYMMLQTSILDSLEKEFEDEKCYTKKIKGKYII